MIGSYAAFQAVTTGTQVGEWHTVLWFAARADAAGVVPVRRALHADRRRAAPTHGAVPRRRRGWLTLANTAGRDLSVRRLPPTCCCLCRLERTVPRGGDAATGRRVLLPRLGSPPRWRARPARWTRADAVDSSRRRCWLLALARVSVRHDGQPLLPARGCRRMPTMESTIVATREGPSETLFVMQQQWLGKPVYSRLVTNGFSMSGTALQGQRYMRASPTTRCCCTTVRSSARWSSATASA